MVSGKVLRRSKKKTRYSSTAHLRFDIGPTGAQIAGREMPGEENGHNVLSYSYGSVKESGAFGFGARHVKVCSLACFQEEYPKTRTLPSDRVELLYTLRCLNAIMLEGWEGATRHRRGCAPRPWVSTNHGSGCGPLDGYGELSV